MTAHQLNLLRDQNLVNTIVTKQSGAKGGFLQRPGFLVLAPDDADDEKEECRLQHTSKERRGWRRAVGEKLGKSPFDHYFSIRIG